MKKVFQYLALCSVLLAHVGNVSGQGIRFLQDEPLEKVLSLAKEKNKIIFIDGYTKTCAPCKELDKKVFPLQEVGDYFNTNFINVKYDLDEPEGKKVQEKYQDVVTGYPSLILLDQDGKMIHKIGGFHPADSLITKMKDALNGTNLSTMRTRMQAGEKSLAFVQAYKKIMEDGYLRDEDQKVSIGILNRLSDAEMVNPKMWQLLGRSVTDPYSTLFGRVVKNYWPFYQNKVTDVGFLEFQLRTAIQRAANELVTPVEKDNKLSLPNQPEKENIILGYVKDIDKFKHTEAIKAIFDVHNLALKGNWNEMITAMKFYNRIQALGKSNEFIYKYVQYMMQSCKDKKALIAATGLLASLPKEHTDVMAYDDNYRTLTRLYVLAGEKALADKYRKLQK